MIPALANAARRKCGTIGDRDRGQSIDYDLPLGHSWLIHRLVRAMISLEAELVAERAARIKDRVAFNLAMAASNLETRED